MKREFLQNFKVGDQPLPKEIIDAIMAENGRDIEEAKKPFGDYDTIKQQLDEAQKTLKGIQDQGTDLETARQNARVGGFLCQETEIDFCAAVWYDRNKRRRFVCCT